MLVTFKVIRLSDNVTVYKKSFYVLDHWQAREPERFLKELQEQYNPDTHTISYVRGRA